MSSSYCVFRGTVFQPQLRKTRSGKDVFSFNLSFYTGKGQDNKAQYGSIRVMLWNELAVNANMTVHERDRVIVEGSLRPDNYEKDGVKHYGYNLWGTSIGHEVSSFNQQGQMSQNGYGSQQAPVYTQQNQAQGFGSPLNQEEIPF